MSTGQSSTDIFVYYGIEIWREIRNRKWMAIVTEWNHGYLKGVSIHCMNWTTVLDSFLTPKMA